MNEVPESLSQSTHEKSKLNLMSITGQNFGAAIGRSLQLGSKIGYSFQNLHLLIFFDS